MIRPTDSVARLGDDEFAVLVDDAFPADRAATVGRRLVGAFETSIPAQSVDVHVAASAGLAVADSDHVGAEELLGLADQALRAAKTNARGELMTSGSASPG